MPDYLLVDKDIAANVQRYYVPELVKADSIRVQIYLPDDRKLVEAAMKDPLLHQRMVNTVQALVTEDLAKLMAYQVGVADAKAKEATRAGNQAMAQTAIQSVERLLGETRSQIIPKIEAAAGNVWKELNRTKKEYLAYQIKCGVKVTASVTSAVLSGVAAGAAVAGTGGALAIALLKAAKDAVQAGKDLWTAAQTAEQTGTRVQKTLDTVATRFKDISAKKAVAFEVAHSFIDPVATPEKAKELNETYGSKLQGLEVAAHSASKALNEVLLKAEAVSNATRLEPKPAPGSKEAASAPARLAKRQKELAKIESTVNDRIQAIIKLMGRVQGGQQQQKEFATAIAGFAKNTPTWVPGAIKAMEFVKDLAGGALDFSKALKAGETLASAAGDLVVDSALAVASTFGDDIVDKSMGIEEAPDAPKSPPPVARPGISAPKLVSTSANLDAMKLKAVPPPKR
jgi:hypothetical protein